LRAELVSDRRAGLTLLLCTLLLGCATLPERPAVRALYGDLRSMVQVNEDDGWIIDSVRLAANAEAALYSVCQVAPELRAELDAWLARQIELTTAAAPDLARPSASTPRQNGAVRSLQRTRALLRYADARANADCPDWLVPRREFEGTQGDAHRVVLLAETHAFATYVVDGQVPALGGGGRMLFGHGLGQRLTLAAGAEVAASGTFIPSAGGGLDATFTLALPVLLRLARFSRIVDVELAPVARFERGGRPLPPGARIELGAGISSIRKGSLAPYFMLYAGYEYHPQPHSGNHTIQIGTRLAFNWHP
jgi:hypothetical protein